MESQEKGGRSQQPDRVQLRRRELTGKILRGKLNYLAILLLSLANCLLNLFHTSITLPFYLMIPDLLFNQLLSSFQDLTKFGLTVTMIIFSLVCWILLFTWFFKCSKSYRHMLAAEIFLAFDLAVLVLLTIWYFVLGTELTVVFYMLLNLLFHIWVFCYVRAGRKAGYALTILPEKEDDGDEDPFSTFTNQEGTKEDSEKEE